MTQLSNLPDIAITTNIRKLAINERAGLAQFLDYLSEVDIRRLYAPEGFSSLFGFCTGVLKLSESEAGRRITACRLMQQYPSLRTYIASGQINLSMIRFISPMVTKENFENVFSVVAGKSTRETERIIAGIVPKREIETEIRRLPTKPTPNTERQTPISELLAMDFTGQEAPPYYAPPKRDKIEYVTEERIQVKFSASESFRKKMDKAKRLSKNKIPNGNLEALVEMVFDEFLERHDPERKMVKTKEKAEPKAVAESKTKLCPKPDAKKEGRYIPQSVKRQVWHRDNGRCTYKTPDARRCNESHNLEFDHKRPVAWNGASDDPENIRLLCRAHNRLVADLAFGRSFMADKVEAARSHAPRGA